MHKIVFKEVYKGLGCVEASRVFDSDYVFKAISESLTLMKNNRN